MYRRSMFDCMQHWLRKFYYSASLLLIAQFLIVFRRQDFDFTVGKQYCRDVSSDANNWWVEVVRILSME